ncbi:hypothetical protein C1I99_25505 [Micromonospora deserti]|uniref:DUF2154 domain-containing protein n=1 Tax=Micromonospora deserti TaxID=2070366 RepID=A0A2W2BQJ3_9ACTN|nr:hypothetical protein C1I99_25505 [Micromonospora deserti]
MVGGSDPTGHSARRGWPRGARLLAAAVALVLALGAAAVVVTLSDPHRLAVAFSEGRVAAPTVTVAAGPGGLGAADESPAGRPGSRGAADEAAERPADGPALTAPLAGRHRASFDLVDPLTRLHLRVADLGDDLYRVSGPSDAGVRGQPEMLGDLVRLRVTPTDRPGPHAVDVMLNARVTWRLRVSGAVTEQRLDLTGARLAGVEIAGGATRTDLRLPQVAGTLVVRITGGVSRFDILVPDDLPVRVRATAGIGQATLHERRGDAVAAGAVLDAPGWDRSLDRLLVDLVAETTTLTVVGA